MKALHGCKVEEMYAYSNTVSNFVTDYKTCYQNLWWETSTEFPNLGRRLSKQEKNKREKEMDKFADSIMNELKKFPLMESKRVEWSIKVRNLIIEAAKYVLGLNDSYVDIIFSGGFLNATYDFCNKAKRFDENILLQDIMQAVRNVWIMNSIQILLDIEVKYTPAVFAYSMLYPYTDNYQDSAVISSEDKMTVNREFTRRLAGEPVRPSNSYETILFDLIAMIEEQYPRKYYPEVYESLLSIQNAQEKSLFQQSKMVCPYETDILGMSFEKGGASVLSDAYLVGGKISKEQGYFVFGLGVFLQLADDLQDVKTDMENRHMTIFSQTCHKWKLDNITSKLFNFMFDIIDYDEYYSGRRMKQIKNVIRNNCVFLLLAAIAKNECMFSKQYIKKIEEYSPFHFDYIRNLSNRVFKEYKRFMRNSENANIDDIFLSLVAPVE